MTLQIETFDVVGTRWRQIALAALMVGLPGAAPAQALPPEVQVGTAAIMDHEFDWGRDGVNCPNCNYGAGNSRFSYVDNNHELWVGFVDFATGDFYPRDGRAVRIDTNVTTAREIGNGPEWMFSQRGSELLYTRWTDGKPRYVNYLTLGFARMANGSWASGSVEGSESQVLPIGSLDVNDAAPSEHYQSFTRPGAPASMYWRGVYPGSVQQKILIGSTDPGMTRRWVPGSRNIIITAPAPPDASGVVYRQVFLYHTTTEATEQLTFDPVNKYWAFMWKAPEFNNENVFCVMVGGTLLNIYRNMPAPGGTTKWAVVNSIAMPVATPYLSSPEPFVHNGLSWVFFSLSSDPDGRDFTSTSLIAMTGIVPGASTLRMLTADNIPARARRDPEHFITANGPYIYYNRYLPATTNTPQVNEGIFRVDTGLGPRNP